MGTPTALAWMALDLFGSLLAPARCAACDARVGVGAAFCAACATEVLRAPAGPHETGSPVAAFLYGGAVATAIARMKYGARPDLARPLGDLLWRALEPCAEALRGVVVVPVPLHPTRLAERGFNQAALLAHRIARHLGAPVAARALVRERDTVRQVVLDRDARLVNVANAFRVRAKAPLRGRAVLLLDDVCTTGATLRACADALRAGGAASVRTAVVARTE
jgi:ComF family protein